MKKSYSYCLVCILFLSLAVPSFAAVSTIPKVDQPLVFFNTNCANPDAMAINEGAETLAKRLRKEGYRVDHGYVVHFDDSTLAGVSILVLSDPDWSFSYTDEDIDYLRQWINNGGGLLYVAGAVSYLAPPRSLPDMSNLAGIASEFGMSWGRFLPLQVKYYADVEQNTPATSPYPCLKIGMDEEVRVSPSYSYAPAMKLNIDPEKGIKLAEGRSGIIAGYGKPGTHGKGRMIAIGTPTLFLDRYLWQRDNEAFAMNIFNYLLGTFDLRATKCRFSTAGNLTGGSSFDVSGKVKNISKSYSNAVKVAFVLSDGTTSTTVATATVPVLLAGDTFVVTAKATLPNNFEAGDYTLRLVIDPDGESNDSNAGNNTRDARKTVEVY